ncbi:hypothetical protein ABS772_06325 [Methylorubrum podarium]|uniref:Helix-turn-helix domain-containing protein n=1 Tax=Methylorubrum podarium TaxID=200476 RepID=A0ABV1QJI7_9HYPH
MQQSTSEPLITISSAAKRLGINRSTLSRQIKAGQVRAYGQKVLLSEVLVDRAANIDLTRSGRREGLTEAENMARASEFDATADATPDATDDELEQEAEGTFVLVDGKAMPLGKARALKETYLARLRQQEFDVKAGSLIDRAAAERAFFEEARAIRDAWLTWPARIAVEAADQIWVDPRTGKVDERSLVSVLNHLVRQHLTELGEPDQLGLGAVG